ncbi:MAG TPA: polyribonucleotide nucleotidyltransferase [Candidatus Limnocylindrales bacterium]|nr:polyribonucleotide nucleotidyltransferase [Candidatus Limnocylindrales bacterium]
MYRVELDLEGRILSLETGKVAKQANGAVWVQSGDTIVLVTAVSSKEPREGIDFFPLMVEYREKAYAAGKIPGGFIKREGKPSDREVLISRLIDRPVRPLFPEGYHHEIQIIATVLSVDQINSPDILAIIGASAALTISDIPFMGPIGAVRIGRIDKKWVLNPPYKQLEKSDINLVMAGTEDAVVMMEGDAREVPEEDMLEAIEYGQEKIKQIVKLQKDLAAQIPVTKQEIKPVEKDQSIALKVSSLAMDKIRQAVYLAESYPDKVEYQNQIKKIYEDTIAGFEEEELEALSLEIKEAFHKTEREVLRKAVLEEGRRADGRGPKDIRPITCEVGLLPRTHGSALFTRGQTQALVVSTLGTAEDEQRLDDLQGEASKRFMLHYNFPPFCVGEVEFLRGPGRREIGHGYLAERALAPVIPTSEEFPYTIRIVSDILESNGSSSMATVCGGTLSLMDAGVPIKAPVAGIAMGLIKEGDKVVILSDISGIEDHLGDMDFKVAGTRKGITALQMDIKIKGITREIFTQALAQAREGRLYILDKMAETLAEPRKQLSRYAPRILTFYINKDKIRDVIGPGGKVIRSIVEETGVKIDIDDDGKINIFSADEESANKALRIIQGIAQQVEEGKIYLGTVKRIVDYGAFVEILPGTDGLLHISQISDRHIRTVTDELQEGDEVLVKVLEIDKQGKIRLSRKAALREQQGHSNK